MGAASELEPFSEKGFYLAEFHGRTLAIAARGSDLVHPAALAAVLKELEGNGTRVVLLSDAEEPLAGLAGAAPVAAAVDRLEGEVWRGLASRACFGVVVGAGAGFPARCREVATRLALTKLVWIDAAGGLRRPDGARCSFVGLAELQRVLADGMPGESEARRQLLIEIEAAVRAGLPAVNVCSLEGLADELFTYAGSGTLFTRERYVAVRRLGLDDYDAAAHLIARGVAEGYLAPRGPEAVEQVLASALGAFVAGAHLAGIGALVEYPAAAAAEIASLYTLTRFVGEGVGGHLVAAALERARDRGFASVFACTTSERVVDFFVRNGFRRATDAEVPAEKWETYDPERRASVRCVCCDLR
ncbi:MAG: GNAT family N-acetyltransferase [Deltaproteobacteria bacterium]|nr:GNAT family N-acetyltransferase [Deltaproteobacteria bacterium]